MKPVRALRQNHCSKNYYNLTLFKKIDFEFIDMFNDTSRYLDDTFTIVNSEFEVYRLYPVIVLSRWLLGLSPWL